MIPILILITTTFTILAYGYFRNNAKYNAVKGTGRVPDIIRYKRISRGYMAAGVLLTAGMVVYFLIK